MRLNHLGPILFALSIHAALLYALQANLHHPTSPVKQQTKEIFAQLIAAPRIEPARQTIEPSQPKPVAKPAASPKPVTQRPATVDSEHAITQPSVATPSHDEAAPSSTSQPVSAEPAPPPPPSAPIFNADYLNNPKPIYPPLSQRLRETGTVILRVHVSAEGLPIDVQLHTSSGSSRLDESAIKAVRQSRFVPAQQGGKPIAGTVLVPITFKLDS